MEITTFWMGVAVGYWILAEYVENVFVANYIFSPDKAASNWFSQKPVALKIEHICALSVLVCNYSLPN